MVKNVEEKNTPGCRSPADHINVLTKSFVIISGVNGGIGIAFYVIVQSYSFTTYYFFKVCPVPFGIGRPVMGQVCNNNWFQWQIVTLLKHFCADLFNAVNRL